MEEGHHKISLVNVMKTIVWECFDNSVKRKQSDYVNNRLGTNFVENFGTQMQNASPTSATYSREEILNTYRNQLTQQELIEINLETSIYCFGSGAIKKNSYNDHLGYYVAVPKDHLKYRYEVIKTISSGSYGSVVEAYDYKTRRNVAVKIFREGSCFDNSAKHEVRMLTHLKKYIERTGSKNIVKFYEHFWFRFHCCLTFELLQNDLSRFIINNRSGFRDTIALKTIVKSVLSGLEFLHELKIIHADLKPNNIAFVNPDCFYCKVISKI